MLTDQPNFFIGQMLIAHVADPLGRTVFHADANDNKARGRPAFCATSPTHPLLGLVCQRLIRGAGLAVGDVVWP
jgi:hypothetical protein